MVVVMTNFNNTSGGASGFRQDLLNAYIPFVEANYRVYRDRSARAYSGLSMGAAYGHNVLINSAEHFAYFGLRSPAGGGSGAPTVAQGSEPGPRGVSGVRGSGVAIHCALRPGRDRGSVSGVPTDPPCAPLRLPLPPVLWHAVAASGNRRLLRRAR